MVYNCYRFLIIKRTEFIIYQIPVASFHKVKELFADINYHLYIAEVLAGQLPGRVFVDNLHTPRTAVIFPSSQHRISIAGDWHNEDTCGAIGNLLEANFRRYVQGDGTYTCNVYATPEWEPIFDRLFEGYEHGTAQRQYYRLGQRRLDWRTLVSSELRVRSIDAQLLAEKDLENRQYLLEEIQSENPSVAYFLQYKYGYCIQQGNRLTNWCLAEYLLQSQKRCELGIETLEPYRRSGLATIAADAVIERALQTGLSDIGWDCWATNEASIATARKLGFEKVHDYTVGWCCYRAKRSN